MTTRDLGLAAERRAESFLQDNGYTIVERNFRAKGGELDLVARERDVICFVEVRSRKSRAFGGAAVSVGGVKQRRLVSAARTWLSLRRWTGACRFDVVAIDGDELELIKDAFRVE